MNTEITIAIVTAIGGLAAAWRAHSEAKKAKYEAERAAAEAARADEAEATTDAVLEGVERFKRTVGPTDYSKFLDDELEQVTQEKGLGDTYHRFAERARKSAMFSREKLLDSLDD